MVRHVVMLKFKPQTSQEEQAKFVETSVRTLEQIPGARNMIMGRTTDTLGKPAFDVALFMDFDSEAKLKAYLEHPVHKAMAAQLPAACSDVKVLDCIY